MTNLNASNAPIIRQGSFLKRYPATTIFIIGFILLVILRLISLHTIKAAATAKGTVYTSLFLYFAQSMFATGPTFFPIIHHTLYPDYLATATFFSYLTSLPFGHATLFSISIPYSIVGALILAFTYRIGALHSQRWGFFAALFVLASWKFSAGINSFALDIFPALATTITFYLIHSSELNQCYRRLWWLPLTLLFGFLTRGPIGLIVPTAIASSYYLFTWRWKKLLAVAIGSTILLVAATALMLWLAYHTGGKEFLHAVMMQEGLARVYHNHRPRFYFYFTNGLFNYFLTALFAIIVVVIKWRELLPLQQPIIEQSLLRQLTIWVILIICAFTLINSKKARYIFSIIPAIALIASYLFVYEQQRLQRIQRFVINTFRCLPFIGLVLAIVIPIYNHFTPSHTLYAAFIPAAIFCVVMIIIDLLLRRYAPREAISPFIITGLISLLGISMLLIEPGTFHPTGEQIDAAAADHPVILKQKNAI